MQQILSLNNHSLTRDHTLKDKLEELASVAPAMEFPASDMSVQSIETQEEMVSFVTNILEEPSDDVVLSDNKDKIISYFKDNNINVQKFKSMNRKTFGKLVSDNNKGDLKIAQVLKLHSKISNKLIDLDEEEEEEKKMLGEETVTVIFSHFSVEHIVTMLNEWFDSLQKKLSPQNQDLIIKYFREHEKEGA